MEVVIITGLSGAGKTKAADWFEDKGYYCIDNMPPALIKNFIDLAMTGKRKIQKAAFVVDIRGGQFFGDLKETVTALTDDINIDFKILFIEASDEALIRRLTSQEGPILCRQRDNKGIHHRTERTWLNCAACQLCHRHIRLKVAEMNSELDKLFDSKTKKDTFVINLMSFGYKHGMPTEADWVIDVRFIPNPYYVSSLKRLTGNNKKVAQYVMKQDVTKEFVNRIQEIITRLVPCYVKEGKYSLTVAFGCTGGQHRSVTLANEFYKIFTSQGWRVTLEHREL